ncbi:MAG: hypothetical protein ABI699_08860 [Caldimonas sp.]
MRSPPHANIETLSTTGTARATQKPLSSGTSKLSFISGDPSFAASRAFAIVAAPSSGAGPTMTGVSCRLPFLCRVE